MNRINKIVFLLTLMLLASSSAVKAQDNLWAQFSNWLQSFASNVRNDIKPVEYQYTEMDQFEVNGEPSASVRLDNVRIPSTTSGNGVIAPLDENIAESLDESNVESGDEVDLVRYDSEPGEGEPYFPDLTQTFTVGGFTLSEIGSSVGALLLAILMALAGIFSPSYGHYQVVDTPPAGFNPLSVTMAHMEYRDFQLKDPMNLKENFILGSNYAISSLKASGYGTLTTLVEDDKWGRVQLTVPPNGVFYVAAQAGTVPSEWGLAEPEQELFTAQSAGKPDKKFSLYKITSLAGSAITFKITENGPFPVSNNMGKKDDLIPERVSLQTRGLTVDDILIDDVADDALDITSVSEDFPGRYTRLVSADAIGLTNVTVPESGKVLIVATTQKATELQTSFTLEDKGEIMTTKDAKVFHLYYITQRGGTDLVKGGKFTLLVDSNGPFIASDVLDAHESTTHCGTPTPCTSTIK